MSTSLSTYVDLIAILILLLYVLGGMSIGLWPQLRRLVSFVGGLYAALFLYMPIGNFITAHFSQIQPPVNYAIAFLLAIIIVQWILGWLLHLVMKNFTHLFGENPVTRVLAVLPAFVDGLICLALLVLVLSVLPIPAKYAQAVTGSHTGQFINKELPAVANFLNVLTGGRLEQALTTFTSHATNDEQPTTLPFKPSSTSVNTAGEAQLFADVNQARDAAGVAPLAIDPALTQLAEAHSQDMWANQYFSHTDPAGQSPADRMTAAGITYTSAGENIALAPTVPLANTDLMNSPDHRANILDTSFHKIGIGVVSGGIYGEMVTEDFTN